MNHSTIDGVPAILIERWRDAHAVPSLLRWRSLAQLCASILMVTLADGSPPEQADNIRTLAEIAHRHQLDMQPVHHFSDRREADREAA